ncbi:acyl carrier protein [Spongiivirga sp. MCCC 1A20706]|uniref:acyl carrier protein n=1 Tax=Spongiivirga sp. MCCC 1A20706 TaxID=3160963 RepID=UPI003977D8DF
MDVEVIKDNLKTILTNVLSHDNFEMKDELTAKDVDGWDSLSHMVIITKIEEHFGIKFKLRDLNKLKNMGSLIALIQTKI